MKSTFIASENAGLWFFVQLTIIFSLILFLVVTPNSHAETSTPAWSFISSPDWFNRDIADLSGSNPGIPKAEGWDAHTGLNGISSQMETVYHYVVGEMAAYNPEVFVVNGDLVNGYWFNNEILEMFDPVTPSRSEAIDKAADIYYGWYRWLFNHDDISPVLGAVGDHELGGDDWPPGSEKSRQVENMKRAFGRNMVEPLFPAPPPAKINGADARPYDTPFEQSSYAYQHRNLLLITLDVFRQENPDTQAHAIHGSVSPDVSGTHLAWLSTLLDAADGDASIDHIIIQGHTPVLRPVRMQNTSGMMLLDREDSAMWQLLRQHDHRQGGKVRIYFGGEAHAVTVSKDTDSDLVQLVHGNPPIWQGLGNYMVFQVHPDRIEAELRRFPLTVDGSSEHWQSSQTESLGVSSVDASFSAGSLLIDVSASETRYTANEDMTLVDQKGLTIHFDFDQATAHGNFSNRGSIGNDFYEGVVKGEVATVPGMFGSAILLNGSTAFVESGRGNITEGESRSVSSWLKSNYSGVQGVFSYGRDKSGSSLNGRFNILLSNGLPRLNIGSSKSCLPDGVPNITDGQWHHIAVVLTDKHHNSCANIRFYVDGAAYAASSVNAGALLDTVSWANIRIGSGVGGRLGKEPDDYFNGAIDDVAMWGSPLTDSKAKAIVTVGNDDRLRYDASALEQLFDLYDAQQGSAIIDGRKWLYAQGLSGSGGEVLTISNAIAVQLDTLGNGVMEESLAGSIEVIKASTPETLPEPGGSVTFDVTINNTSVISNVVINSLTDNIHGDLNGTGNCSVPQTIDAGESYNCSFIATVSGSAGYSETDRITARGTDGYGNLVRDVDTATVTITGIPSSIEVIKTATPETLPEPGGEVTFDIIVNNLSLFNSVSITSLVDDVHGNLQGKGSCFVPQMIAADSNYSCSFNASVTGNAGFSETDTVTAGGTDEIGINISHSDTATVTITSLPGSILVVKTAAPEMLPEPGGEVTYDIVINNTSTNASVTIDYLKDNVYDHLHSVGSCTIPQTIAVGASYGCSFNKTVNGAAGDTVVSRTVAKGKDEYGNVVRDVHRTTVTITEDTTAGTSGCFPYAPSNGKVYLICW